jgi:hypothetical protein
MNKTSAILQLSTSVTGRRNSNTQTAASLFRCTQPYLTIPFTFKRQDIQGEAPNCPLHIAAHLQGTQNPTHRANLAKELQSPTHGKHS